MTAKRSNLGRLIERGLEDAIAYERGDDTRARVRATFASFHRRSTTRNESGSSDRQWDFRRQCSRVRST